MNASVFSHLMNVLSFQRVINRNYNKHPHKGPNQSDSELVSLCLVYLCLVSVFEVSVFGLSMFGLSVFEVSLCLVSF